MNAILPAPMELDSITTGYDDVPIVRAASMTFKPGIMTAIIGSNGAGKSTVIKAAAGLIPTWSGRVLIGGVDITKEAAHLRLSRGMAYIPQGRIVVADMTVAENLELGAFILGGDRKKIEAATARVVELFPVLGTRLRQRAGTMSGGEQQMLAIGRALMTSPNTVILDEPSLGLSPKFVEVVFSMLSRLAEEGMTIVMVEQKATSALKIASYGYVMHIGKVAFKGSASELLENENVRRLFLGEVPEDLVLGDEGIEVRSGAIG